jgi:hypothetical protein
MREASYWRDFTTGCVGYTKMYIIVKLSFSTQGLIPNTTDTDRWCKKCRIITVRATSCYQNVCGKWARRVNPKFANIRRIFWIRKAKKKMQSSGSNRIWTLTKFPGQSFTVTNCRQGQGKVNIAETGQKKWRKDKRQGRKWRHMDNNKHLFNK